MWLEAEGLYLIEANRIETQAKIQKTNGNPI